MNSGIRPMSNNQVKKRAAENFNKKRREAFVESVRVAQDKIDNPEKYNRARRKTARKIMPFITTALALGNSTPTSMSGLFEGDTGPERPDFKEEPKFIRSWEELAEVGCSDLYRLEIGDGAGWIKDESGDISEYLSTHTFYGRNHEYSTKLLQSYGFNVVLDNWDKKEKA